MNINPRKLIAEFVTGLVSAAIGFWIFSFVAWKFIPIIPIDIGGCKGPVFQGLFFGLPLGSIIGIYVINKWHYKTECNYLLATLSGLFCSVGIGDALIYFVLARIGDSTLYVIPPMMVVLTMIGFYLSSSLIRRNEVAVTN